MGGRTCSVFGCSNTEGNTRQVKPIVSFYSFPGNAWEIKRRSIWTNFTKRKNLDGTLWKPTINARICSQHFVMGTKSQDPRKPNFNPTIFTASRETSSRDVKKMERYERAIKRRQPDCSSQERKYLTSTNVHTSEETIIEDSKRIEPINVVIKRENCDSDDNPVQVQFLKFYENVREGKTSSIVSSISCKQIYPGVTPERTYKNTFNCISCTSSFSTEEELQDHLQNYKHDGPYLCEICGQGFASVVFHRKHVQTTDACRLGKTYEYQRQRKRFQCTYCNISYCRNDTLVKHLLIHTGERPFKCDQNECNLGFRSKEQLEYHSRIHRHPYKCIHCEKTFPDEGLLNRHLNAVHEISHNSNFGENLSLGPPLHFLFSKDGTRPGTCRKKLKYNVKSSKQSSGNVGPGPMESKSNTNTHTHSEIIIGDNVNSNTTNTIPKNFKFEDSEQLPMMVWDSEYPIKQEVADEDIGLATENEQAIQGIKGYMKSYTKGRLFTCAYCGEEFDDLLILDSHTKKDHKQRGMFVTTGLLETIKTEPS